MNRTILTFLAQLKKKYFQSRCAIGNVSGVNPTFVMVLDT
jgi:hypothetical protein